MPEYLYRCDKCGAETLEHQSIKDEAYTDCVFCETEGALYRVIHATDLSIKSEPKTLGHLASRNTDKMSSMERSEKFREKPKKDTSTWYNPSGKVNHQLPTLNESQKRKYIETGKLPDGSVDTEKPDIKRLKDNFGKIGKEI